MGEQTEQLLRRLTAGDETSARLVMALHPNAIEAGDLVLAPRVRMLVRLASLIAAEASTTSLRWAVELAACAGADEDEIVRVLALVGPDVGFPCVVATAPRLALALDYETGVEDCDS
jgi:alkylhydroperoxidase/carboxymuconolactone decarboxylase family protein YurZ